MPVEIPVTVPEGRQLGPVLWSTLRDMYVRTPELYISTHELYTQTREAAALRRAIWSRGAAVLTGGGSFASAVQAGGNRRYAGL